MQSHLHLQANRDLIYRAELFYRTMELRIGGNCPTDADEAYYAARALEVKRPATSVPRTPVVAAQHEPADSPSSEKTSTAERYNKWIQELRCDASNGLEDDAYSVMESGSHASVLTF